MVRFAACLSLLIVIVVGVAVCEDSSSQKTPASKPKATLRDDQVQTILDLESQKFIKVKAELNAVYIKPDLWEQMPYDTKNDFCAALAVYCANKKGSSAIWVEFFDYFSGRKLAKWSQAFGFKTY